MFLAVDPVPIDEDQVHGAIHAVLHAIKRADRSPCPDDFFRVELRDGGSEQLELPGHRTWIAWRWLERGYVATSSNKAVANGFACGSILTRCRTARQPRFFPTTLRT